MNFNEIINSVKSLLKENLTAENTSLFTQIDKGLDNIVSAHKETEDKLSMTQDKLLEVVKGTSFKSETEPNNPEPAPEKALSIDEAFEVSFGEIQNKRK